MKHILARYLTEVTDILSRLVYCTILYMPMHLCYAIPTGWYTSITYPDDTGLAFVAFLLSLGVLFLTLHLLSSTGRLRCFCGVVLAVYLLVDAFADLFR